MNALLEAPLDISFNRAQTARRRMAPGTEPQPDPPPAATFYARLAERGSHRWHVIEIETDEDWQYAAAEIYYPPPPDRPFELWATFESNTFLIYPSEEALAKQFLAVKLAKWEPGVEDDDIEVDHGELDG